MSAWAAALLVLAGWTTPPIAVPDAAYSEQMACPSAAWATNSRRLLARHVVYPPQAMRQGITGTVQLTIDVDRDGQIQETSIARSSGEPMLDEAALDAARAVVRFDALPCLAAHSIRVRIPVVFRAVE